MGGGSLVAGKVGYAVSCVLAAALLAVSGVAYHFVNLSQQIGGGIDLGSGPMIGAQNVLVMGLESRTDYQGHTLSAGLLAAMHAGSVYGVNNLGVGGQATNTLILVHIFDGGQKAVGFSIPRDDWVTYPQPYDGQSAGKIDQAYGLAYAESLGKTVNTSMSSGQRYLEANQAGQAATVATVEQVTGQKINHFAEVNLAGFYYLAQSFGGITVCLKSVNGGLNLHDANSGFNAVLDGYSMKKGGSQYLHLKAPQALAFVRERDNLPNGDLDRTHRQQAVIDYVIWKLKSDGILGDLRTANNLLGTAKQYIITDAKWNLLDFSTNMRALSGKNLSFYTAPIVGYATIGGQAANQIDIPTIQAVIKEKFTAPAKATKKSAAKSKSAKKAAPIPPASSVTVDVYNGAGVSGLAGNVSQALVAKGYKAGQVTNASAQSQTVTAGTQVFYGKGASANAEKIAKYFGATAKALTSLTAGHVDVLLGTGSTVVPGSLSQSASASASASATAAPTTAGDNGAAGSAVSVAAKARYGVPCVY
ncbi:LytR family transcriptional regulator [Trebonia kvetii]|uniref:LytR family transcriptional regulator n=1 Tax=Trebonia kvetii TaxID=2480626 RepID=A0A6P2C7F0_9ACTN|nr:LCP family protein [Trebonia kvetii]TVZ07238.1 LytR family transcriptional regulator [Trebonia kvetii]